MREPPKRRKLRHESPQIPKAVAEVLRVKHAETETHRKRLITELTEEKGGWVELLSYQEMDRREERDLVDLALEFLAPLSHLSGPMLDLKPDTSTGDIKILALEATVRRCTTHLTRLARSGEPKAVNLLARQTLALSKELSDLRRKSKAVFLKAVAPVARESLYWPVLKSHCEFFDETRKNIDPTLEAILRQLGKNHPFQGQKFKLDDDLGRLALKLFEDVQTFRQFGWYFALQRHREKWEEAASKLGPFKAGGNAFEEWWAVMELYLSRLYPTDAQLVDAFQSRLNRAKSRKTVKRKADYLREKLFERLHGMLGCRAKRTKGESSVSKLGAPSSNPRQEETTPEDRETGERLKLVLKKRDEF